MKILLKSSIVSSVLMLSSCEWLDTIFIKDDLIRDGLETIEEAKEFDSFFPNARHSLIEKSGAGSDLVWHSTAIYENRYWITMGFEISFSARRKKIKKEEEAYFCISEFELISFTEDGEIQSVSRADKYYFGEKEWNEIFEGKDFTKADIHLLKNMPVEGMNDLVTFLNNGGTL